MQILPGSTMTKQKAEALDPAPAVELGHLLEEAKQSLALLSPDRRVQSYQALKDKLDDTIREAENEG